jgi:Flp pilus assembly protein TadG
MKRHKERGSVVLMAAVLLPVLLFIIALGIDFGIMYGVRNSAQTAADAAAMAGVYAYSGLNPNPLDPKGDTDAQVAFNANFSGTGATLTPSPGGYPCSDGFTAQTGISQKCYQVTVTTASPTFFARVFGKQSVSITVKANAIASTGGLGFAPSCVKPIFVPDQALNCTFSNGALTCGLPPKSTVSVVPQTAGNCSGSNCTTALVPSDWYQLDFSSIINPANPKPDPVVFSDGSSISNSGAATYDASWTGCVVTAIRCGDLINVQTGGKGSNTDADVKQLLKDGISTFVGPIWDQSTVVPNGNGYQAQVVGFAQFSNLSCGTCAAGAPITATFDAYLGCQSLGGNTGNEQGFYTTPVRLIKVQ